MLVVEWVILLCKKKVLDDNKQLSSDILYLQKKILNSKKYISNIWTATWILLRQNKYFDKWGFSYIWVKEFNKTYCQTWEITKTNHLYVSNFIPLNWVSTWTTNYKSDTKNNQILKKISWNWERVVWRDIYWDKFSDWDFWTWVFLNSPTWIVEIWAKVVFSDTLNDRVLYLSGSQVYTLLDEKDWLEEPTWLAYNNSTNSLYISNSGKWEVLRLSSESYWNNPQLKIDNINKTNINKLEIEILDTSETLTDPLNYSNYSFGNSNDFVELENNKMKYYFLNNYSNNTTRSECSWKNTWDIILNYPTNSIKCTNSTWSWTIANFRNVNIYNFTVDNIKPLLSENKSYYVKIDWEYFPYFTQWDDDIFTKDDNTLEVIHSWLTYPTKVNNDWTYTNFNSSTFDYNSLTPDFVFSNPVVNLDKNYSTNLLNLKIDYYKYLNCFNVDDKIKRSFLIKKNF